MVERLSVKIGSEEIHFETGRIARQAHGAVLVTQGESVVLSTACMSPDVRPGTDFFPMTVEYREKSSAAGRIPGNFFRREARPSEREILTCRLTDRPLRPLFPKGFHNEVLVFSTIFSADNINNPDVMSINGASAALHISQMPFAGPIGAVRIGLIDGELVVNPLMEDMQRSQLDLVMAGTREAVTMVEGEADELSEDKMLEALELGHENIKRICDCLDELRAKVGLEKIVFTPAEVEEGVMADVTRLAGARLIEAFLVLEKHARQDAIDALKAEIRQSLLAEYGEERFAEVEGQVSQAFSKLSKEQMRNHVLDKQTRVDGRRPDEIRQITIEVGFLPRTHGSALFTRGETQAIVTTTLGTSRDEQRLDELSGEEFRRFMLHYNFPSYSVGEVRRVMGPGRREIGHGKLAERSLARMLPVEGEETDFPYVIRVLSDVTESNGSSSMATVCGGTLSLMDAGVPLKAPVAGIAMGLIKEGERAVVLSDILGDEDHLGDMDFKICGSRNGITAFQMDCKIAGVSRELMTTALQQAREGRLHILGKMEEALPESRPEISPYAPRIYTIKIPVDSIREVIGPGGKIIREIQAKSGAEIEIQDDGTVHVAAVNHENADAAIQLIRSITAVPEVGQLYKGVVTRLMNFGAFVSIVGNKEGLVHISELAPGRVESVEDVVSVGDEINIKVVEIDRMGRVNLSKVEADRELGLITDDEFEEEGGGGDRPPRDRDRGGDRGGRGGGDRGGRSGGGGGGSRGGDRGGRSGGGGGRRR